MIDPHGIHDALNLLPEDLLAPVDALRRKKRFPWKSIVSVAACLCLCVGLWFFFPGAAAEKNAAGGMPENGTGFTGSLEFSTSCSTNISGKLEVYSVSEDHITVIPVPRIELSDDWCVQIAAITVNFENLQVVPELHPGQHIRIYYDEIGQDGVSVSPYRIEIIKEETK